MAVRNLVSGIAAVAFASSFIFMGSSCREGSGSVTFLLEYESEVTVPASSAISVPFELSTPEQATDIETHYAANNTRSDLIVDIFAKGCKLEILSPGGQTFDFLNSIEVYLVADGFEELLFAQKTGIPEEGLKSISLPVEKDDFLHYVDRSKLELLIKAKTDQTISEEIEIGISVEFEANANPIS